MKVCIAGSRGVWPTNEELDEIIRKVGVTPTSVIEGGADGVDKAAMWWSRAHGIPHVEMPADWATHGTAAGPLRNIEMAKAADVVVAVWNGKSPGTASMIKASREMGRPTYVFDPAGRQTAVYNDATPWAVRTGGDGDAS